MYSLCIDARTRLACSCSIRPGVLIATPVRRPLMAVPRRVAATFWRGAYEEANIVGISTRHDARSWGRLRAIVGCRYSRKRLRGDGGVVWHDGTGTEQHDWNGRKRKQHHGRNRKREQHDGRSRRTERICGAKRQRHSRRERYGHRWRSRRNERRCGRRRQQQHERKHHQRRDGRR